MRKASTRRDGDRRTRNRQRDGADHDHRQPENGTSARQDERRRAGRESPTHDGSGERLRPPLKPVPTEGPSFIQVQSADMLSSNVVGLDIYNSQNNDIGKIQDIAFDCIEEGDRVHSVRRRLPWHGHALCRGQSGRAHGFLRRSEQVLEGDDERHEGPAQVGSGIQVRRPVDGEQKLSGEVERNGASAPFRSKLKAIRRRATMADKATDIDHVWKLIEDIPIAMVVTHEGQGQNMRARPMAVRPARDEGAIFFLTDADTPKAAGNSPQPVGLPRPIGQQEPKIRVDFRPCGNDRRQGAGQEVLVGLRQGVLAR